MSQARITVIGGSNMDIGGRPAAALRLRDSNPGAVLLRPGGVGRNIAHDLCLLGAEVSLVTALGDDLFAQGLRRSCESLGMDLSMTLTLPGRRSSSYLYVSEAGGEMHLGIADMDIVEELTPAVLERHMASINRSDAVVIDANLSGETVDYVARHCTAPLYADPVSTAKAGRLLCALPRLRCLKPNALEAEALTGEKDPERAARALLAAGVTRVFVSLAAEGMLAAEGDRMFRLPCLPCRVVNTTGAGDAAMAAVVWAGVKGLPLEQAARAALKAGAITAACAETNPASLSLP